MVVCEVGGALNMAPNSHATGRERSFWQLHGHAQLLLLRQHNHGMDVDALCASRCIGRI